jgi:hypothetical protein
MIGAAATLLIRNHSIAAQSCASGQGCVHPLSAFSDTPDLHEWQLLAAITAGVGKI